MAIRHGRNLQIYVRGIDISGEVNEISTLSEQEMADVTVLGDRQHQLYPGLAKDSGTIQTIYNSTDAAVFVAMRQNTTDDYGMMMAFGSTAGDPVYASNNVALKANSMKGVITDINRATYSFDTNNYPFEECKLIYPKGTIIATGQAASYDGGASTGLGGAGYLQVFGVSTGTLIASIQDSSTDAWAGEQTTTCIFTAASSAESQRITISGTIKEYTRAAYIVTSTCTFAVALKRY